ncbi:MAG: alpha-ketoglutarate-dependent dioxygenase AlkB [Leeuwenhoekiella sp.]
MLFENTALDLNLDRATITYYPKFLNTTDSKALFEALLQHTSWREVKITVFGKTYLQPRLTALQAENSNPYSYSNLTMHPVPFCSDVLQIKKKLESFTGLTFTTCLLNLYRDGKDSNGWHADDEKELGSSPIIASVSLGATRTFKLRRKKETKTAKKIDLTSGSLLLMQGKTQTYWQHQIPKTAKPVEPRINLTFRTVL